MFYWIYSCKRPKKALWLWYASSHKFKLMRLNFVNSFRSVRLTGRLMYLFVYLNIYLFKCSFMYLSDLNKVFSIVWEHLIKYVQKLHARGRTVQETLLQDVRLLPGRFARQKQYDNKSYMQFWDIFIEFWGWLWEI